MLKGVIFDLDGVITSTAPKHFQAWQQMCSDKLNINLTEDWEPKLRGVARMACLDMIVQAFQITLDTTHKETLLDYKNRIYTELISHLTQADLLPGILPLLQDLKTRGIKIALASVSQNAIPIINKLNIKSYFNYVVDIRQIQNTKPAPDLFLDAVQGLGLKPSKVVVVDDSPIGLQSATNGHLKMVAVGFTAPHWVVDTKALTWEVLNHVSQS